MSKILVIGEAMLDTSWHGESTRISPEAPVPIVNLNSITYQAGGAANVCMNIASLGHSVAFVSQIGDDIEGIRLQAILDKAGVDTSMMAISSRVETIQKLRIYSNESYTLRVDNEILKAPSAQEERLILTNISKRLSEFNVVVISDYNKLFLSHRLCHILLAMCNTNNLFAICDPKGHNIQKYVGADLITPNRKELFDLSGASSIEDGVKFFQKYIKNVLLTKSEEGLTFYNETETSWPALNPNPVTVVGCGDSLCAGLAVGISNGMTIEQAIEWTNPKIAEAMNTPGTIIIK